MSENKKTYYWLKLQNNFFNSLEIKTVLKHEKGAEYVIFWQKLLLEVIDKIDSGFIRYKESIPYTPEVLATITDTDIDTVKGAMTLFIKMEMLEVSESGDLIVDEVIQEMVGRITDQGIRKSNYRKKIKELKLLGQCPSVSQNVPTILEKEIDIDIEKELEIDKEKDNGDKSPIPIKKNFIKPSNLEINEYCLSANIKVDVDRFIDFYESNGWMVGKNKMKDWKAACRNWSRNSFEKKEETPKERYERVTGNKWEDM